MATTAVFLIANAVDDHDMGITHVIRDEDLLNTAPKVMLLWDALGYGEKPVYAHLPLLVNEQRKKLSKRVIRWRWPFRDEGICPMPWRMPSLCWAGVRPTRSSDG